MSDALPPYRVSADLLCASKLNPPKIERMISLNPDCEIQHHALALGESDGETSFLLMPDETMGKLKSSSFQSELSEGERSIDVTLRSIDSMIESGEIAAPALMKIDVEGAEEMVLKGGLNCLKSVAPSILLEYHSASLARACHDLLVGFGYDVVFLEGAVLEGLEPEAVGHFLATKGR